MGQTTNKPIMGGKRNKLYEMPRLTICKNARSPSQFYARGFLGINRKSLVGCLAVHPFVGLVGFDRGSLRQLVCCG